MKRVFFLLLMLAQLFTVSAQDSAYLFSYFKNNGEDGLHLAFSQDGLNWTSLRNDQTFLRPAVANDRLMRDPCIIRGADGLFHMVWTVSWNDRGIGYASSADLINWSEQRFIPVMQHEDSALNCWAPEITYDARQKQYMIYWATTIPGRFMAGSKTGDSKYNHRIYYTTTPDFREFSPTALLYDKGFNVIDATIFSDRKKYVMLLKDETRYPPQKNIRLATSDSLNSGYGKPSRPITGKYWAEGPTAVKIGERWIVYFDKYMDHQYGAVMSKDLKHWTDISESLHMPAGMRHGSVLKISAAELSKLQQ